MQIQNSIQFQIISKIRQELDINEYSEIEIMPLFFKNHRIRGNKVIGVRLTKYGLKLMEKSFTCYNFKLQNFKLSNKAVIKLDQTMQWPYYVDNKQLVLFSEKDSVILKLKGQNLEKWLQGLRKPKKSNSNDSSE
jgi:hypothetical protein|tara:strand:+ start:1495 stop:1899 length:405 start_codon:yes stop_codon:yes gene_type:complete